MVIKTARGEQHGGKAEFYIFLGMAVDHMNGDPWFLWVAICSIVPYAASLMVYKWLKAR